MNEGVLVCSLFPGIGLLDRAFEEEGFTVVRGPDLLWGGDIRRFHLPAGKFDGVIGGPPCKAHTRFRGLIEHNHWKNPAKYHLAEDLIPEFERCISEAQPGWFLMENVPLAPRPNVAGYRVVSQAVENRWLGEEQRRKRVFSFGSREGLNPFIHIEWAVFENPAYSPAVCASGTTWVPVRMGGSGKTKPGHPMGNKTAAFLEDAIRLQGLPADFLREAPFTVKAKIACIGNGVPLPMGRAVARAVKRAMGYTWEAP